MLVEAFFGGLVITCGVMALGWILFIMRVLLYRSGLVGLGALGGLVVLMGVIATTLGLSSCFLVLGALLGWSGLLVVLAGLVELVGLGRERC